MTKSEAFVAKSDGGLNKVQKTEVQNEVYKILLAGGLLVTLVAGVVGYMSGQKAYKDKEAELDRKIKAAGIAIESANATAANIQSAALIEGWPSKIICQDTRFTNSALTYELIQFYNGTVVYRHNWPDTKELFEFKVDAKTREVISARQKFIGSCAAGTSIDALIAEGRAYGVLKLEQRGALK